MLVVLDCVVCQQSNKQRLLLLLLVCIVFYLSVLTDNCFISSHMTDIVSATLSK